MEEDFSTQFSLLNLHMKMVSIILGHPVYVFAETLKNIRQFRNRIV